LISEFLANPGPTDIRAPGAPEPSEWIELVNNGTTAVDLAGWVLSDNKDIMEGWTMPTRVLAPGEYVLIYLTGTLIRYLGVAQKSTTGGYPFVVCGDWFVLPMPIQVAFLWARWAVCMLKNGNVWLWRMQSWLV
jgi:hypothetical protein